MVKVPIFHFKKVPLEKRDVPKGQGDHCTTLKRPFPTQKMHRIDSRPAPAAECGCGPESSGFAAVRSCP